MEAIHCNPFRVLGLPIDASEKEIVKRISDLEMYAEMGKSKSYDSDYPHLSPVTRTVDAIRNASNQIETSDSRFFYSMFWFWNNNSGDFLALDLLKDGNTERAIALLEKQLDGDLNTDKYFSSIKNLSILHMALARNDGDFSFNNIAKGLVWAGRMLQVDAFSEHARTVAGNHFSFDKEKIANLYVDEVLKSVYAKSGENGVRIPPQQLIPCFTSFPAATQQRVVNHLLEKDFRTVDDAIELSKEKRKKNPQDARVIARTLCEQSKESIKIIRDALGIDNYKYQSTSDRLAEEIDQCGTDYYNYHTNNDTGIDPGEITLKISEYALAYATSVSVQDNIKEGIQIVKSWIEGAEGREKLQKIQSRSDLIVRQINKLPDLEDLSESGHAQLLSISLNFIADCRIELEAIKKVLGYDDEFYLSISSGVVNRAMDMCIEYANKTDKSTAVLQVFNEMKTMSMDSETEDRFNENYKIFTNNAVLETNLDPIKQILNNIPNIDNIGAHQIDQLPGMAKHLIDSTSAYLSNLARVERKLFVNASSAVANTALGLCIAYANKTGNMSPIFDVMMNIGKMEMEPELRNRFEKNKSIIFENTLNAITQSSSKKGCYIATMVYGDYDAPQVLILRRYRDNVMGKCRIGRMFIAAYYKFSPIFVKYLGQFNVVHVMCKAILDRIVRRVA